MIDICTRLKQEDVNCACMDCAMVRCLYEKIRVTRMHPFYRRTLEWAIKHMDTVESFKILMEAVFAEKQPNSRSSCYRALALLIYTFDLCRHIKDNDLKNAILLTVENGTNVRDIDWTVLMNDENTIATSCILKTLSLKCGLFLLNCYSYYLKMF